MRNNVLRMNETTNYLPHNVFAGFEVRRKERLMFWRQNYSIKGKCYIFSGDKQTNNVCFVNLECKLPQDTDVWHVFM